MTGVAALVRQKYPQLNAFQVINRLKATAHAGPTTPDPVVGWGVVDPLAALTWNVADPAPTLPINSIITPAPPPPPPDFTPRRIATYAVGGFVGVALIVLGAWAALRRKSDTHD